ncbi:hypothetical protein [Phosphitispora fastidiosa]|uniref:hypothetical protein n=1 Tax=Phosphitispora fastidiosa TaxID=2837202 RepID=UPI001E41F364|nr:hypothetical protein [Phosphitispora fastidiosa]MBU7006747.1 hypothetical protein [Phosphitispora fastidiosa]
MRQQYNCIICGHVTGQPFCQGCMIRAKQYYDTISEFIKANPNATVMEIYNSTSVPLSVIKGIIQIGWMEQSS